MNVDINPAALASIARSSAVREACLAVAREIVQEAVAFAPQRTGDYARGLVARETPTGAEVVATDFTSRWVEYGFHPGGGATYVPGRHVLTNAVDRAGYRMGAK